MIGCFEACLGLLPTALSLHLTFANIASTIVWHTFSLVALWSSHLAILALPPLPALLPLPLPGFATAFLAAFLGGEELELDDDDDDDDDAVDELGLAAEAAEVAEACHCIFLSSNSEVLLKLPSCTKARSKNSLPCSATSLLSVKIRILWWASLSPSLALAAADSASFCLFFALAAADSASFCLSFALAAATSASFSLSFALAASALASFSCRSWWRACRLLRWALEF